MRCMADGSRSTSRRWCASRTGGPIWWPRTCVSKKRGPFPRRRARSRDSMAVAARTVGDTVLKGDNISLAVGGGEALTDISSDVREREVRGIIGPNGAGKSSLLNVINGVYHPQKGTITFHGRERRDMDTHEAAAQGIARTFQNIALFRGMSVLDNIMTGRNLKMRANFLEQAVWVGPARREEVQNRP